MGQQDTMANVIIQDEERVVEQRPAPVWRWTDVVLIGAAALAVIVLGLVVIAVGLVLLRGQGLNRSDVLPAISVAGSALEVVALLGSVYLLGLRRKRLPPSVLGLRPLSPPALVAALVLGFAVIPLSSAIATGAQLALRLPPQNPQEAFLAPQGLTLPAAAGMVLLVGLLGPFAEEVFFRGIVYSWLRSGHGAALSAVLSGLVFALVHLEPSIVAATFVLGIILALVYERTGSLWSSVIIHAVNNTAVILVLYLFLAMGGKL